MSVQSTHVWEVLKGVVPTKAQRLSQYQTKFPMPTNKYIPIYFTKDIILYVA